MTGIYLHFLCAHYLLADAPNEDLAPLDLSSQLALQKHPLFLFCSVPFRVVSFHALIYVHSGGAVETAQGGAGGSGQI